jgi:hypothetical protein
MRLHLTAPVPRYCRRIAEYVLTAELADHPGVIRGLALSENESLDDLHHLLRNAFGWDDDHLYSFWLDGEFWSDPSAEYTSPVEAEPGRQTADVALGDLDLRLGQELAYVFDFGDEWRVLLRVDEISPQSEAKSRVLHTVGEAPPQYGPAEES